MPVTRRPARSMVRPASSSRSRSDQSRTFGPNTAAAGDSCAPASKRSSASGAGSQSSWSSHTHSFCSCLGPPEGTMWVFAARCRRALATAAPYPVARSIPNTAARPKACASIAPLRSLLPASTATTRCTGLVWLMTASTTCGSHAAPSCATITAVTMSWLCALSGDTYPLAARSGHLRRLQACPPASPGGWARGEQYANRWGPGRQTLKGRRQPSAGGGPVAQPVKADPNHRRQPGPWRSGRSATTSPARTAGVTRGW